MKIRVLTIHGIIFQLDNGSVVAVTDPSVITSSITDVRSSSAKSGGIVYDGGASITERGICWSLSPNPTILDNKTNDGIGSGTFISTMTGLSSFTTYYVRAYATNSIGLMYGDEKIFTTENDFRLLFGIDSDTLAYGDNIDDALIWN